MESGQISIIPKPECFEDFGGIPLLLNHHHFGADQPAVNGQIRGSDPKIRAVCQPFFGGSFFKSIPLPAYI